MNIGYFPEKSIEIWSDGSGGPARNNPAGND